MVIRGRIRQNNTMITVRFFAMLRGLAKTETKEYAVEGSLTVAELKKMLQADFPAIAPLIAGRSILVSVNQEFATPETVVADGDEVGLLPPFSGG